MRANQSISTRVGWLGASPSITFQRVKLKRDVHYGDRLFRGFLTSVGLSVVLLLLSIGVFLFYYSWPAIQAYGLQFVTSTTWDPVNDVYGALPVIFGTIVSSFLAVLIAAPMSLGIALFINELAPHRVGSIVGFLVEMLAAIPSVVYGLWGIFVLAPFVRVSVAPWVIEHFGFIPLFSGPAYGVGMLTAALILSIMIVPTISSISREVFKTIDRSQREGALALGATKWEAMSLAVLRSSRAGILGAVVLGLGRALGETMAVTMVIGNRNAIAASLFAPGQTMASLIASEYGEAMGTMHLTSLTGIGLALFGITFLVNMIARMIIWRVTRVKGAR